MWIVMTSSAQMPTSVHARYRNVALVKLTREYAEAGKQPAMISSRARGVERLEHWGHHNVGKMVRSAYAKALAEAQAEVDKRNNGGPKP